MQANWQLLVSRKTNTNTTTPFIYNVEYTFEQVKEAVQECTGYDLVQNFDDEHDDYVLIDPYGDQDGDPFYSLQDVIDYVTDNDQVNKYLKEEFNN